MRKAPPGAVLREEINRALAGGIEECTHRRAALVPGSPRARLPRTAGPRSVAGKFAWTRPRRTPPAG